MAMSKTTNTYNRQKWEDSDFPILCQTCLGDNPYVRMMKEKYGKECHICSRPFTTFRWCPGQKMRFKKTEICQSCSKLKNVCQTCLLDLKYGLPTQVRDSILQVQDNVPKSNVNKEYYIQNMEKGLSNTDLSSNLGPNAGKSNETLQRLARTAPYYQRNRPHICSFWVKGECKRGEECPYRHEKPTDADNPLSDQKIRDRYYGVNDPVADKLLKRVSEMPALPVPADTTITTLYIGNLGTLCEEDIKSHFYQYGEIRSIKLVPKKQCGFIQYTTRLAAENAAQQTFNKLVLGGRRLTIKWGNSKGTESQSKEILSNVNSLQPVPGLPTALPELNNFFGINSNPSFVPPEMFGSLLPPSLYQPPQESISNVTSTNSSQIHYPSQDPERFGFAPQSKE